MIFKTPNTLLLLLKFVNNSLGENKGQHDRGGALAM